MLLRAFGFFSLIVGMIGSGLLLVFVSNLHPSLKIDADPIASTGVSAAVDLDGTWGEIYPRGAGYPVNSERERRVFAHPQQSLSAEESLAAANRASGLLADPAVIQALREEPPEA